MDRMPKTEEEVRALVDRAFPFDGSGRPNSWGERTEDEKYAYRLIGEYGPYIVRMLLDLLDQEREKSRMEPGR